MNDQSNNQANFSKRVYQKRGRGSIRCSVSNLGLTRFNKCEDVARHKTGTREGGRGWRKHKMAFALLTIRPEDQASVGKV